ncbi:MAG: hypothetical protein EOO48_05195 [Flavobacterium sp.]|nr:MAG: hypothetical protein EOO48_05195 [Flavobacterium sp.]
MKRLIALCIFAGLFVSCSNDVQSNDEGFFNLDQGTLWVYRRFGSNDNVNFLASNRIHSVSVSGTSVQGDKPTPRCYIKFT